MTEIRGFFPVNRKRKVLGTIPVTLNLKEGTMKVTRKEALEISRQTLERAEQERQEERKMLKRIEEMSAKEMADEVCARTGVHRHFRLQDFLAVCRDNDIGTENLAPNWKRWRKWPEEKPIPFAHVEWELKSPQCVETGIYIPFESAALPFRKGLGRGVGSGVCCWRYIEEPPEPLTWKNVARDGNPSEVGWYEIPSNMDYRRFRYWDGVCWTQHMGGSICGDPTDYCIIAPAPKFEE